MSLHPSDRLTRAQKWILIVVAVGSCAISAYVMVLVIGEVLQWLR